MEFYRRLGNLSAATCERAFSVNRDHCKAGKLIIKALADILGRKVQQMSLN